MMGTRTEDGFTLIELLITILLLSLVSIGFYQVLFAGQDSSDVTQDVVEVSAEARLGLNRMLRDTREAASLQAASANSYRIRTNFDGDSVQNENPNQSGDYEEVTFTFVGDRIAISAVVNTSWGGGTIGETITETLMDGVSCVPDSGGVCRPVFTFTSNILKYDADNNGQTTYAELTAARNAGATDLSSNVLSHINGIDYLFNVQKGDQVTAFRSQATLRNLR